MRSPSRSTKITEHCHLENQRNLRISSNFLRHLIRPAFAAALALPCSLAWCQGGPQFQNGFPHAGQPTRRDPAEGQAYSAAVAEPNLNARISAIQQFMITYPTSSLRQPAIAQMLEAQKELRAADGGSPPMPASRPVTAVSAAPLPTNGVAAPPRDSLLQQPPKQAQIAIEPHSLSIKADNATLSEILQKIASSTGMKLEGFSKDERIFGTYGPGETHDVLLSLLEGSGYNVMMVGEVADGRAPRELSLSTRTASTSPVANAPAAGNPAEEEDDDQEIQQVPPAEGPPVLPGRPNQGNQPILPNDGQQQPRTPQQVLQDLQRQRQQQDPNQAPQ